MKFQFFLLFFLPVVFCQTCDYMNSRIGQDLWGEQVNDYFGYERMLSISGDGQRLASGSETDNQLINSGHFRAYEYNGTAWGQIGSTIDRNISNEQCGTVSLSNNGSIVAFGCRYAKGSITSISRYVEVYQYNETEWNPMGSAIVSPSNASNFGSSLSLSNDGTRLAVGAYMNNDIYDKQGYVQVYELSTFSQIGGNITGTDWTVSA